MSRTIVSVPRSFATASGYEWKAVTLLTLGFGLVGLDRWIIAPLFPAIMHDFGLSYQDLGNLIGILGVAWGVTAIIMGRMSDRFGRRKVLIPSLLLFSLLSGVSGLAGGLLSLCLIRGVIGATEGAFTPASGAAVVDASHPRRRGMNLGLQMGAFGLFGLGFGPILATQLLAVVPSWRWVFFIVAVPGFIVALLMAKTIREPDHLDSNAPSSPAQESASTFFDAFRYRNVWLALLGLLGTMTGVWIVSAMTPNYLVDVLHLSPQSMGFAMSGLGFGGFTGEFVILGLSDFAGRRPAAGVAFLGAIACLYLFSVAGASPTLLFFLLFLTAFFAFGLVAMLAGPVAAEAAPVVLMSSSMGIIGGVSEIFGGGAAPSLAGFFAGHFGLHSVYYLAMGGFVFGLVVCLGLRETAPRRSAGIAGFGHI